jgi:hypothetical protein
VEEILVIALRVNRAGHEVFFSPATGARKEGANGRMANPKPNIGKLHAAGPNLVGYVEQEIDRYIHCRSKARITLLARCRSTRS